MITETGIVTQANETTAWIKTTRYAACKGCASKGSCGTAHGSKETTVLVKNTLNVDPGDAVVIGMQTRSMVVLSFLLYVFPIIFLVVGAVIGDSLSGLLALNPSISAMAFGFTFFALAIFIIRKQQHGLSQKEKYRPFLVRKQHGTRPPGCQIS